jgi:hypothetical protein
LAKPNRPTENGQVVAGGEQAGICVPVYKGKGKTVDMGVNPKPVDNLDGIREQQHRNKHQNDSTVMPNGTAIHTVKNRTPPPVVKKDDTFGRRAATWINKRRRSVDLSLFLLGQMKNDMNGKAQ